MKDSIIRQMSQCAVLDNAIIQKCRYDMTTLQDKILLYMISKVKPTDTGDEVYNISIRDYCEMCGIELDSGKSYQNLKEAILEIDQKYYLLKMPDQKKERRLRWFNRLDMNYGSGIVEYSFHNDMKPFVYYLQREYTMIPIEQITRLRSKYSVKLYKLFKSYANMNQKKQEWFIDDFKRLIGAEKYTRYPDFRRYVIEQALNEINGYTDIIVEYKPEKRNSKAVNVLVFEIKKYSYY